jgi:endonuclease YncB( thermonuclease family)
MKLVLIGSCMIALATAALPYPTHSADVVLDQRRTSGGAESGSYSSPATKISGRISVIDGRTLWFPNGGHTVRLASIDACELPQWSYDLSRHVETTIPKPVPCGPLAKAWLKRTVGSSQVTCMVQAYNVNGARLGRCSVRGRDLALEMLRVGWARTISPAPAEYLTWQNYAMSARYGIWATYVLDMHEWRAKAIDRTLSRQPIADFNLLAEREREISPPFEDARKRPKRTDR